MNHTKSLLKLVVVAFIVLAASVAAFLIFKPSPEPPKDNAGTTETTFKSLGAQDITTEDFVYQKPEGWAKLSKELLDSSAATSGIGLPSSSSASSLPMATFTVKLADSIPKNDKDLKDSILLELKKLTNFELVSSTATKVDGKSGQRFIYKFGEKDMTKQELNAVVHNKKTFFLLFSSADKDFDSQGADFTSISSAFKFK